MFTEVNILKLLYELCSKTEEEMDDTVFVLM